MSSSAEMSFMDKVKALKLAFCLDDSLKAAQAISKAKELIGLVGADKLPAQATQIMQFLEKVAMIKAEFNMAENLPVADVINGSNEELGLLRVGSLLDQANEIADTLDSCA